MNHFVPVNHAIMPYSMYNQAANHNLPDMICRTRDVMWLDMRVSIFGTIVTQIIPTKNGWKKRSLNLVYDIKSKKQQKWYETRNILVWGITEQPHRNKMWDGIYKTQGTFFLPGTSLIWDSWSKIQDPKTIQQWINPTFRLLTWVMAVLHFSHRHGRSHIMYQLPHHNHRRWATNVNHMTGKDLWCGWRFNFGQPILNVCYGMFIQVNVQ